MLARRAEGRHGALLLASLFHCLLSWAAAAGVFLNVRGMKVPTAGKGWKSLRKSSGRGGGRERRGGGAGQRAATLTRKIARARRKDVIVQWMVDCWGLGD